MHRTAASQGLADLQARDQTAFVERSKQPLLKQLLETVNRLIHCSDGRTNGHGDIFVRHRNGHSRYRKSDSLSNEFGFWHGGAGKQHHELVTADSGQRVTGSKHRLNALRDGAERNVTSGVAKPIIGPLEGVTVEHDGGQRRTMVRCPSDLTTKLIFNTAALHEQRVVNE